MPVKPTTEQIRKIAERYNMQMNETDLAFFESLIGTSMAAYSRLDQLVEPALPVQYPRTGSYRPGPGENPLNAWYQKCLVKGAETGPLAGKRIALKDNICLAGVPMMNGSATLEGYTPEFDATIVTRMLAAGGEIIGKAVCEHLCLSGGSHTSDTGPVSNPHNPAYSAGGSSSGSAALVVAGECDMAIGCDQGGSIRMPSAWCGAYGLKPTHGLVPYTGICSLELTIDHAGPIAATVEDVALLLEAIAGPDGLDPRQNGITPEDGYVRALVGHTRGLRIGILKEGFGWPGISQADVEEMVEASAHRFVETGASVSTVSIPMHRDGIAIGTAIAAEGALPVIGYNGAGTNWKGYYPTSLMDAYARGRTFRANDLADTVKMYLLLGQYMQDQYQGHYYGKARNLARLLTKAYDDVLQTVDVLVMPTLPLKATRLPAPDASREEKMLRTSEMITNTMQFDVTGHPAMSVPCGLSEGLPVGMMLVGRRGEDSTVLRAAHAFEQISGYTVRPQKVATAV